MGRRATLSFALVLFAASLFASDAESTAALLSRAQSLAWAKQFNDAASIYLDVLRGEPDSYDATLGLARVRLWQGHYGEARRLFGRLLERNRRDTDAAEGAATAAYWSGDYRTAERELRAIVAAHPDRESARRSLNELHAAAATTEHFDLGVVDDDQPFRGSRSEARVSVFSDPLTRWDASAGANTVNSDAGGRHAAPFVMVQNESVLPSLRLTMTSSIGAIRTPDSRSHAIGGVSARLRLARNDSLTLAFTRREILSNATKLYPLVAITSLRWQHPSPWLAYVGVERDRFSDHNTANAADGYVLLPVLTPGKWKLWAGASALWRDTRESRFYVTGINAVRDPSGRFFHYTYRGAYDPYWTPHDLVEGRLILAIERRIGSGTTMRLQGDSGRTSDKTVTFWPDAGPTSFPSEVGRAMFDRTDWPWRVRFNASTLVARGITVEVGYERSVTAFYRANSFHAALARRR